MRKKVESFDPSAIIKRIRLLRNQCAGARGKSKFARSLGISASTYSYYENDRLPPIEILLRISEVAEADLEWLLTGRTGEKNQAFFGSNATLLRKLQTLLRENPALNEPILAFIELLGEKQGLEKQLQPSVAAARSERLAWIPVLGRTAAGTVHFWDQQVLPQPTQAIAELDELVKKHIGKEIVGCADGVVSVDLRTQPLVDRLKQHNVNLVQVGGQQGEEIVEFIQCDQIHELFPDSFALQIDGDSMSPRINDGDFVILSPSVPVAQGQIGIARVTNQIGVTCKLIRTSADAVHLIPINEKYETKVIPKQDMCWALAVLCHITV